jgi:general secretion pathway protein A
LVTLIGEVGTGKSTLLRVLLEALDSSMQTILVTHTTVGRSEVLAQILEELGLTRQQREYARMVSLLREHLLTVARRGLPPPLLIIDEAQNLNVEVMEEVRLLTNLETAHSKLLQVILSGQPELGQKLSLHSLRQLRQRIGVWAKLEPLARNEVRQYVEHRLNVAGGSSELFSAGALDLIWHFSGGIPRIVNILCQQSLLYAFAESLLVVEEYAVREAAGDIGLITGRSDLNAQSGTLGSKKRESEENGVLCNRPRTSCRLRGLPASEFLNSWLLRRPLKTRSLDAR